ncbi:cell division ATP-binding protein FtsE [candidate division Kazan bacterium RIFCSPHIGHO2_01_FULL_49_10]|uniref:Cell division ATP-binding protein FtsE n=1 Tax=candidate division Kazan bacterium RIFCSPLOWO2_01_FULL_48_13 TaxID=1798539 RepID=A0A1F4PNE0_UNCK3|nr:MAG: cell division ATP-binding protein FtsE [candidate division Kazan bacterium RIFCSPHIGHO2_01_FULL_49_10]OGB85149.1 MAG: cell division ATP-binding protein FtsE [candidate division Kazan bacterium RIFCSPLOWO2_01_FULL_48_13]
MIQLKRVTKHYGTKKALDNVSFAIMPREFVSLVGPSGAGKSTLIKLLTCEEYPTFGEITIDGKNIHLINQRYIPYYRRQIGVVYQDFKLLPNKTVYENVAFAMEVSGAPTGVIRREVMKIIELVGLKDKVDNFPKELSGGEAQRVAIARALVFSPRLLIADEPTGNLDPNNAWDIAQLLLKINRMGTTVILATHNREIVDAIGKRVLSFKDGKLMSDRRKGKYKLN